MSPLPAIDVEIKIRCANCGKRLKLEDGGTISSGGVTLELKPHQCALTDGGRAKR